MRTTVLTRSAVAVASLALGSMALAAAPATASPSATPPGVTRDLVLTAAAGLRLPSPTDAQELATYRAVRTIANRVCAVDIDNGDRTPYFNEEAFQPSGGVDGLLISASIYNEDLDSYRGCNFAAVATTDPKAVLNGSATLTGTNPYSSAPTPTSTAGPSPVSGTLFVTTPAPFDYWGRITADLGGNAVTTTTTKTVDKVSDQKTKAEKKAAKKTYKKRLKAAKKAYQKALDQAGSSKTKKAAAKEAYRAKRASIKAAYEYAIADYKLVTKKKTSSSTAPFTLTAQVYNAND